MNITEPAFYKGCQKEDSPYYMYSIPGYDPCFYFDFSKTADIKFKLTCRSIDDTGVVELNQQNVGYQYRDVVVPPQEVQFNYVATNPETKFSVLAAQEITATIDFRDWKWLSNYQRFQTLIKDPQVLVGNAEATITVDFSKLESSDGSGDSYFVVGGRAYFEANVFGKSLSSFTTKGFFDKEGYVEPKG